MKLTESEITALKVEHKSEKNRRKADRIKSVLMRNEGLTYEEIGRHLLLDEDTIRGYVSKYKEGGIDHLLEWNYQGRQSQLTKIQEQELDQHLEEHCYQKAEDIIVYIQENYQKKYSLSGITKLLKRLGYSYKQFTTVPVGADSEKQEEFIKEYEELKKTKGEDDVITFTDATHPNLQTEVGRGWIKKGTEKEIPTASGRQRINILGAINLEEKSSPLIEFYETINRDSVVDFIEKLENKYPNAPNIHYICDNAKYFYAKEVKEKLKNSRVKIHYLPTYSPNLNPIEAFWKFFKQHALKNRFFPDFKSFKSACLDFFNNLNAYSNKLDSFISDKFRIIDSQNAKNIFQ